MVNFLSSRADELNTACLRGTGVPEVPPVDNPLVQFLSQERRKLGVLESTQRAQARSFRSLDRFGLRVSPFSSQEPTSRRMNQMKRNHPLYLCALLLIVAFFCVVAGAPASTLFPSTAHSPPSKRIRLI